MTTAVFLQSPACCSRLKTSEILNDQSGVVDILSPRTELTSVAGKEVLSSLLEKKKNYTHHYYQKTGIVSMQAATRFLALKSSF